MAAKTGLSPKPTDNFGSGSNFHIPGYYFHKYLKKNLKSPRDFHGTSIR